MAKRGEHFSAEFKFKVVLETLREESTLAEIASKYDVTSKSVTTWKKEFIENGVSVFNKHKDINFIIKTYRRVKLKLIYLAKKK